ncbi:hypothetical protein F5141DRAFT_1063007 [Pisolithus sp. B1]|nr:hypothetical protein F5141DRAFT_1063007 [Pisolithus sp. B1]
METPVNPSPSSLLTKQSRSPSKHQFLSEDGVDNVFNMNYPPMEPMRLPQKKDMWKGWGLQVPRLVQQWTGDFFKDSALHMTGLQLHLGHDGAPCPSTSMNVQATLSRHSQPAGLDEEEWEDIDYIPLHLHPPVGSKYLTVIDMTGPCQCMHAESYHKQLLHTKLYPSTFEKPSMVFTFLVLDDFLRDNVECGTSGMNYYSKLHQVAQQWCLLKLLKRSGYQGNLNDSMKGDLAIFCAACPQLGINLSPQANLNDWRYTRTVVMDGNFKAEHMSATPHIMEKSACNNHKAISQTSASHGKLNSMGRQVDNTKFLEIAPSLRIVVGIGMWHVHGHKKECYARYFPLFIRGSGWVDGEIIETLWSTLNIVSTSTCGMTSPHHQELLDFQMNDSNFMKMIHMISSLLQKLKVAQAAVTLAREAFERLNEAVPSSKQENWWRQEEAALKDHVHDPSVMDIFEIQLTKVHGVELHLLQTSTASGMHHGATSWLTCGLVIEEVEVTLSINRVAAEQKTFIMDGRIYLQMDTALDDSEESDRNHEVASQNILVDNDTSSNGGNSDCSADDMQDTDTFADPTSPTLPLPSNLGADWCYKAVIFRGVVRSATNYSMRTWAWQMVHSIDRTTMIALGAKPEILEQYQELQKSHLTTSTAAFTQGVHDHQASQLPWFWSIDIPRDTSSKSWLTEFYRIHWLHTKAGKDHWEEEEELLTLEFQWVINYF